mgnify:CR=1 FL=1
MITLVLLFCVQVGDCEQVAPTSNTPHIGICEAFGEALAARAVESGAYVSASYRCINWGEAL